MTPFNELSPDEIYLRFYSLGYRERLSFFEKFVKDNPYLGLKEKNEMAIDRVLAIFEVGRYEKFLYEVDAVIELVMEENIFQHNGEDIYSKLLFKKAAAHYNLDEFENAKEILQQLKKIDHNSNIYQKLIHRIDRKKGLWQSPFWKSMVVIGYSISFFIYLTDIFVVEPFLFQWHESIIWMIETGLWLSTALLLVLTASWIKSKW